jgi:DNA (cytosine-5)-methyltransferase 1
MRRPRLFDGFCKAGGSGTGWHRAGFEVVGVDVEPQPRYPFEFYQADVFEFLAEHGHEFDVWTGSPPCRDHTSLASRAGFDGSSWMLPAFRELCEASGLPYVIENVPGAPMRADVTLCGEMFELRVIRHRRFESNVFLPQPHHPEHTARVATSRRRERWDQGWHASVTGDIGTYIGPEAMGIDWMTGDELSNAIPPAYTEFLGRHLVRYL